MSATAFQRKRRELEAQTSEPVQADDKEPKKRKKADVDAGEDKADTGDKQ